MCEEGLLWKAALEFLGPVRLYQTVVDLWVNATSPSRSTVEYLAGGARLGDAPRIDEPELHDEGKPTMDVQGQIAGRHKPTTLCVTGTP